MRLSRIVRRVGDFFKFLYDEIAEAYLYGTYGYSPYRSKRFRRKSRNNTKVVPVFYVLHKYNDFPLGKPVDTYFSAFTDTYKTDSLQLAYKFTARDRLAIRAFLRKFCPAEGKNLIYKEFQIKRIINDGKSYQ